MIQKGDPKIIRAWTFYDWANSVYPLVISSAVFPILYEAKTSIKDPVSGVTVYDTISFFGLEFKNTEFYAYLVALSYLVVAAIAPILSGIADATGNKKRFLQVFCFLGAISSALLFFFDPKSGGEYSPYILGATILPLFFASIGYWGSLVYYNAYLPEIAEPAEHDKISARGFSMGYLGSALLLIIILILTQLTKLIDIHWAFPLVGAWWIIFAMITFRRLPNNVYDKKVEGGHIFQKGYHELGKVWADIKTRIQLRRYLASYFMFNMAVQTVMIMATAFANKEVRGIKTQDLIISILLIQFVGMLGSFIFSRLSGKIGNMKSISIAIIIWIGLCVGVYFFVYLPWQFYIAACVVGLVMGGIQALARSTYSKMLPETEDHASYFSFFDVSEKIGLAIGTFTFGLIEGLADIRTSVLALVVFFILGFLLLMRVPKSAAVK